MKELKSLSDKEIIVILKKSVNDMSFGHGWYCEYCYASYGNPHKVACKIQKLLDL